MKKDDSTIVYYSRAKELAYLIVLSALAYLAFASMISIHWLMKGISSYFERARMSGYLVIVVALAIAGYFLYKLISWPIYFAGQNFIVFDNFQSSELIILPS